MSSGKVNITYKSIELEQNAYSCNRFKLKYFVPLFFLVVKNRHSSCIWNCCANFFFEKAGNYEVQGYLHHSFPGNVFIKIAPRRSKWNQSIENGRSCSKLWR
mmetsp:Transcript_36157/g.53949  ORF Transcript_36157/g.53949 Transcript_36157/m.53949 type:complete len:102 (+) Transcript_36157:332-637(+)